MTPAPVWFVAHGGPPTLYDPQHPAHKHWVRTADSIRQAKLKGIVFVSAHWQAEQGDFLEHKSHIDPKHVLINIDETNPLIYDFYNFPKHYYEAKFNTRNPNELSSAVAQHLKNQGYYVQSTKRGIDHGVWVPLLAAFGERMNIPLVQVSLPVPSGVPKDDGTASLRLGRALKGLREEGYAIIGGGQPVHNLRDFMTARITGQRLTGSNTYGETFPPALTDALVHVEDDANQLDEEGDPKRWSQAKSLFARSDYLKAHPTSEHLLREYV